MNLINVAIDAILIYVSIKELKEFFIPILVLRDVSAVTILSEAQYMFFR